MYLVARLIHVVDPVVMCLIPAPSHTFMEVDNKLFSSIILLLLLIEEGLDCFFVSVHCNN